jgi:hypothetical protein
VSGASVWRIEFNCLGSSGMRHCNLWKVGTSFCSGTVKMETADFFETFSLAEQSACRLMSEGRNVGETSSTSGFYAPLSFPPYTVLIRVLTFKHPKLIHDYENTCIRPVPVAARCKA